MGHGLLRAAQFATTPLLPRDYLGLVAPLTFGADLQGRIVERRPETPDATTLVIRAGRRWQGHVPGQYVRVGVDVDGVRHWRAYSLTHGPDAPRGTIAITVKRLPGGRVSEHLVDHARPGDLLVLDQATGDFTLPVVPPGRLLFLTAGSGITPVIAMLRHHVWHVQDATVVHSAPRAEDVVFGPELRALAAEGGIHLVERHTAEAGLLDLAELDDLVPDWRRRQTWVCGPTGLLDDATAHWEAAGSADRLHVERFRPAVAVVDDAGGEVSFTRSGLTVDAPGDRPILDSGEEAGALLPSGCRMGICFGCALPLREGVVRDLRTGELTEGGDGVRVQTCISAPAGACEIDG
ncbi:putative NADPH oxidoreductase [Mobilicoccus pelagius NBRC 104925]|uniref:Putative NADPH oxidoreductase n=1 Tax=Mobilicoccus pelagius NBRC 104925 TaxID=1089455 RepID=H5UVJ8_9MICO|nr:putative NADPH oxidoreductase [Mobilicoccus pelagius NBRC 104925]